MKKIIKPVILIVLGFLLLQSSYGQVQKDMTDYLKQKFLKYSAFVPREEIFLQSDRDEYVSGEDLWFSVYLIDRQSSRPSFNNKIVYFELLNAVNRPVVQKRILIDKGIGPGQVVLPDTLSTGIYTIRAYTSWMKNFLPYNCFMKDITVYNTLITKAFKGKVSEGNIIKKGTGNNVNEEIKNTGVTLRVNNSNPDSLEIFVNADNKFRSENNDIFYIFIQTHGIIDQVSTEKMTEETTKISIPKALLSSGINQITIFNSKGEPISERFIYTPVKENNFLTLHSVDSCNLRDKITLEIEFGNEVSTALNSTNLSISVAPLTNDPDIMDMNDYMVFGTEYGILSRNKIKGRKISELPPEVMDSILINVRSNWINWATILSGDLHHFKYQIEKEDHFLLGKLLTNDQHAANSAETLLLCTPGKEAGFQYSRTDNEGNFSFRIHIDEGLKDLIIMPDDVNKNHKIIIESSFSDQYLQSEISVDSINKPVPPQISKWSVNYQVSKIYGVSTHGGPLNPIFPPLKPIRFYGKPDIELIMADYISLPVMEEVFFELLPRISLKKKKSIYDISIADRVDDNRYVLSPCLLIDGVIIRDPSLIANLDPEIVERIDVIKEKYLVGKYFFSGIVNVITKSGDYSCVSLPDYMIRLPYRVIDPVWSFVSPDYSSVEMKNSRLPDYRNTLYWNPSVKPGKDGKDRIEFWSSDNKSDYVIDIQGITQEGKIFSLKKIIKVK
ncbi:MAG: hypothetical protein NTV31_02900 [Bacteroidia bacterium]|nr:hypothetical protein [Bacteroidia bacterium]